MLCWYSTWKLAFCLKTHIFWSEVGKYSENELLAYHSYWHKLYLYALSRHIINRSMLSILKIRCTNMFHWKLVPLKTCCCNSISTQARHVTWMCPGWNKKHEKEDIALAFNQCNVFFFQFVRFFSQVENWLYAHHSFIFIPFFYLVYTGLIIYIHRWKFKKGNKLWERDWVQQFKRRILVIAFNALNSHVPF